MLLSVVQMYEGGPPDVRYFLGYFLGYPLGNS
jgi:hypothetical protein